MTSSILLSPDVTTDSREQQLIASNSREIAEIVISTMLNTFSRREARKKIMAIGFSKSTADALVGKVLKSSAARQDLADSYKSRTGLSGLGAALLAATYFIPDAPMILVRLPAVCLVYGTFSAIGWLRYSRPVKNPFHGV